jgi:hypothetical protein
LVGLLVEPGGLYRDTAVVKVRINRNDAIGSALFQQQTEETIGANVEDR